MIIVKVKDNTFKDISVRRQKVLDALSWLTQNNPHYKDVEINDHAVEALPVSGIASELLTVETNDSVIHLEKGSSESRESSESHTHHYMSCTYE